MSNYGVKAIQQLEGIEAIRKRSGMYIGSVGIDGLHHIVLEIISNAIDEYLNGHCTQIAVRVNKDGEVLVADNGRGIPVGKMEDGMSTLEAVFSKLHTGAKFASDGSTGYNSSGGMNGVGAKATNALSDYFFARVYRDKKIHTIHFEKGIKKGLTSEPDPNQVATGTTVWFKPDATIFKEGIHLDMKRLGRQIQELSFLCKGLEFTLIDPEGKEEKFLSTDGLLDYVRYLADGKQILTKPFYCDAQDGRMGVEIALLYVNSYSENIKLYTNNIPNSSGTHLTGFKTAMTRAVNEYARDKKLLKDGEENLTGDDLKEGMVMALSFKMPDPVFSGQTKDVLTSSEGRGIVERLVAKEIRVWLENNANDAKTIVSKALLSRKAREAARKAREATRKKAGTVLSSVLPGKLADCSSKNPEECEIYLVEGK